MSDKKIDHITVANKNGVYVLQCNNCRKTYMPNLPISIDMFLAVCKAFENKHRGCKEILPFTDEVGGEGWSTTILRIGQQENLYYFGKITAKAERLILARLVCSQNMRLSNTEKIQM